MGNRLEAFYGDLDEKYLQGDLTAVERFLLESIRQAEKMPQGSRDELIAIYNELGSFYRGISRYAQSIAAFEKARALAVLDPGRDSGQYATILNNMAGTCRLTKDYDTAIALFREAAGIYRRAGLQDTYAYASVLNNMALVYREAEQYPEAIGCLKQALGMIENMPGHMHEVAVTYNNLTALYSAAGDRMQAMQCLQRALQAFEKCSDEENVHYAAGLNSLAAFLYAEGDCERAIAVYRKSAKYTLRFFGENIEYGITCQNMSHVYEKMGRKTDAAAALERAKKVYENLFGPEHERTRAAEDDLQRLRKASGA